MPLLGVILSESPVEEKTTARIAGRLVDEAGAALGSGDLASITVTLYDRSSGDVINGRNATSVLNLNGGTVDADGNFTWTMDPDDSPIMDADKALEQHVALFQWAWAAGAKVDRQEVIVPVRNLAKVS